MTATESMKFFFFLVLLVSVQSKPPPPPTTQMHYVLRWAPTFCLQTTLDCKVPIPTLFALHGVWPTDASGNYITLDKYDCGNKEPSNWPAVFKPKETELNKFWADLVIGSSWALWKHEWSMHGTCATTVTTVTVNGYFDRAIETHKLFNDRNLYAYMSDKRGSGVIAGNSVYTEARVVSAAQKVFGTNPRNIKKIRITCTKVPGITTYVYLKEVYFCTDVSGRTFVDCLGATSIKCSDAIMLPRPLTMTVSLKEAQRETIGNLTYECLPNREWMILQ